MAKKILSLQALTFAFPGQKAWTFFKNINLSFSQNSMHFIRGKNGAGKSTLFRLIQGTSYPEERLSGILSLNNKHYNLGQESSRSKLHAIVRMVPQKFDQMLADQFTFTENLQLAIIPHYPQLKPLTTDYTIPDLVKRFGIPFDAPVNVLSGGQRQILAILMALQKPTSLLLLDEPTAALDDKNSKMVIDFLHALLKRDPDLTVLIICHDKEIIDQYATSHYYQINVDENNERTISAVSLEK